MTTVEKIIVFISALTAIAGILLALKTLIDTRNKYYKEFLENRKSKKNYEKN